MTDPALDDGRLFYRWNTGGRLRLGRALVQWAAGPTGAWSLTFAWVIRP